METMRESWTDDRLDDLNGKMDLLRVETRTEFKAVRGEMKEEFSAVRGEMKEEFAAVRREMKEGFDRVDARFERLLYKIDERFQSMDERLLATHRTVIGFCGLMFTALIGVFATFFMQI
jgi:broad specificity phosphatase PhoE